MKNTFSNVRVEKKFAHYTEKTCTTTFSSPNSPKGSLLKSTTERKNSHQISVYLVCQRMVGGRQTRLHQKKANFVPKYIKAREKKDEDLPILKCPRNFYIKKIKGKNNTQRFGFLKRTLLSRGDMEENGVV